MVHLLLLLSTFAQWALFLSTNHQHSYIYVYMFNNAHTLCKVSMLIYMDTHISFNRRRRPCIYSQPTRPDFEATRFCWVCYLDLDLDSSAADMGLFHIDLEAAGSNYDGALCFIYIYISSNRVKHCAMRNLYVEFLCVWYSLARIFPRNTSSDRAAIIVTLKYILIGN